MLDHNKEVVLGALREKISCANSNRLTMADFCWHMLQGILWWHKLREWRVTDGLAASPDCVSVLRWYL